MTGASTAVLAVHNTQSDSCDSSKPSNSNYCNYTHFIAKDSDSDSDVEEPRHADTSGPQGGVAKRLTAVQDFRDVRFCRVCNEFLPVDMFPEGQRRFTCRPHLWQRVKKKSIKTMRTARSRRRLLASIWTRADKDNRRLGLSMALTQQDVAHMLDALEASENRKFSLPLPTWEDAEGLLNALRAQQLTSIDMVAVLPTDLSAPFSKDNATLVTKQTRRALLDKCNKLHKAARTNDTSEDQQRRAASWRPGIQSASLL